MDYDFKESVWCLVTLEGGIKQLIGVMYRSPSSTDENNQKLLSMIRESSQLHNISRVLLMGDFNVPAIDWQELTYSGSSNDFTAEFLCAVQDSYLSQHITGFTRFRQGQRPSLLDLVFTYNPDTIDHVKHCSSLGSSDHECLMWQYKVSAKELDYQYAACRYNFWKGNYPAMCEEFDIIDWDSLLQNDSLDTNWKLFKHRVLTVANKFIQKLLGNQLLINHHGGLLTLAELLRKNNNYLINIHVSCYQLTMQIMP